MGVATGFTAERMLTIEKTTIVGGHVDSNHHLILQTREGTMIDAGYVKGADATALLGVTDTDTINFSLTGAGTPASPWALSGDVNFTYENLPQTIVSGLLSPSYPGTGPAAVKIDGDSSFTNNIDWAVPYIPWGSRRVSLGRYGSRWVIIGQSQYESFTGGHKVVPLTPATNWYTYNQIQAENSWADGPYATQLPSGLVVLSGLLRFVNGVPTNGALIASGIPAAMRPSKNEPIFVNNSDTSKYVEIRPDGSIYAGVGLASNGYVSLDGVSYWPAGIGTWTNIGTGGSSFGPNFEAWPDANNYAPSYWKDPYGFVWFRGLLRIKTTVTADNTLMVNLPTTHRTAVADGAKHMRTVGQDGYAGVGATGTATGSFGLEWKINSPGAVGNWISLHGLAIPSNDAMADNDWTPIRGYANGWTRYLTAFPVPAFLRREDGLVMGKGLIAPGTTGAVRAFALPREMWPNQGRLILESLANNARSRIDVSGVHEDNFSSGRIRGGVSIINGAAWVSLDNLKYVTSP